MQQTEPTKRGLVGDGDEDLLCGYRDHGDLDALDILVRRHTAGLMRYLNGLVRNPVESQDLFQEVWMRVIRRSDGYHSQHFKGWLMRIAHNAVIDHFRKRRATPGADLTGGTEGTSWEDTLPSSEVPPDRRAAGQDDVARLAQLIHALPEAQREVFLMRVTGDLSFREIARMLRVPLNTALGRMHYAVTRLRAALDGQAGNPREGRGR